MVNLKGSIYLFVLDKLPKGIIPISKDSTKFLINTALVGEESGYLYSKNHDLVYTISNDKRVVTNIEESDLLQKAEELELPILKVTVGSSILKQAELTIFQATNPELEGKAGVIVDLNTGYTFEDIPWLPAFCVQGARNEFEALKEMYDVLLEINNNRVEEQRQKEAERERQRREREAQQEAFFSNIKHHESPQIDFEDDDISNETQENLVYTVEADDTTNLMATHNKSQALDYGEQKLPYYSEVHIRTWQNGRIIKTLTLREG